MNATQPEDRIKFTRKEVDRYQDDVESWKKAYDAAEREYWVWVELAAKANFLFDRIMDLDTRVREGVFSGEIEHSEARNQEIREILREWQLVSESVIPHLDRAEKLYGQADGAEALRQNVSESRGILTSDEEFFDGERISALRDEAIEDHRAGRTEPLSHDG